MDWGTFGKVLLQVWIAVVVLGMTAALIWAVVKDDVRR